MSNGKKILYQDETKKALENFKITGRPFSRQLAHNIALVKIASAQANEKNGKLNKKIANAIIQSATELIKGDFDEQLIVDEIQGGAGTSMNMNVNEIIAGRASIILGGKSIHPIDHVNMSQSTNDVVPTAMKITALQLIDELILAYDEYQFTIFKKAKEFKNIIKAGRTHLQDAVPITLGQEFSAHASVARRDRDRLKRLKQSLYAINLGGTAVGTAITASAEYIRFAVSYLGKKTGYSLYSPTNLIDATQYADGFMEVSAILTVLAANTIKFMNDLRLLASGPRAGLGEISFTSRQKGSSIMPGKVNPVMAETVNQVCFQVIGNNQAILMAVQAGQLELNVMLPIVARNLFESLTILKNGIRQFTKHALETVSANKERCAELFNNSLVMSTALTPHLGYDIVATYVRKAINENKSLKQVLLENKVLNQDQYNNLIVNTMI